MVFAAWRDFSGLGIAERHVSLVADLNLCLGIWNTGGRLGLHIGAYIVAHGGGKEGRSAIHTCLCFGDNAVCFYTFTERQFV